MLSRIGWTRLSGLLLVSVGLVGFTGMGTSGMAAQAAGLTGAQIIEKAVEPLRGVRDASLEVTAEQFEPGSGRRLGTLAGQLQLVAEPAAIRFALTEPAVLAGQIMMIDGTKQQVAIYSPANEQVLVQPLSQFGRQFGAGLNLFGALPQAGAGAGETGATGMGDLRALLHLPEQGHFPATLVRTESLGGSPAYVVDVINTQALILQRFWVRTSDYRVLRIETYDARNRLTSRVSLGQWKVNTGLQAAQLLKWPAGATLASTPNG